MEKIKEELPDCGYIIYHISIAFSDITIIREVIPEDNGIKWMFSCSFSKLYTHHLQPEKQ